MARILITSLGTGEKKDGAYKKANYEIEKVLYPEESFISKALTKHFNIDTVFIVGTSGSIWDEVYSAFGGADENKYFELYSKKDEDKITSDDLLDIEQTINKYINGNDSRCFLISYGLNDEELWQNFEQYLKISEYINDGDELYLDITHSFRSLAMMSFLMTQFIEQVRQKDIKIRGIFYGMFEYSKQNKGITPVVNMSILAEINEWTKAIGYLKYSGNATMLYQLLKNESNNTDKETEKVFMHLSNSISMGNITGIKEAVQTIKKRLSILESNKNPIVAYISNDVKDFVQSLDYETESDFCMALAKWFLKNYNYGMSYIVLADGIIAKMCELNSLNPDLEQGQKEAKNKIYKLRYSPDKRLVVFYETFDTINDVRNSIAHSTDRRNSLISDIANLPEYIRKIESGFAVLNKIAYE